LFYEDPRNIYVGDTKCVDLCMPDTRAYLWFFLSMFISDLIMNFRSMIIGRLPGALDRYCDFHLKITDYEAREMPTPIGLLSKFIIKTI
jgi:hypothetical protein